MFDPPGSVGATEGTFYMYGPDADQLFEDIKRALEGVDVPAGTTAVIRGEGEPKKVELG